MSTTTTTTERVASAAASFIAAERDDKRRGIACRDMATALDAYAAAGIPAAQAYDDIAEHVTVSQDGRVKAPKAATIKAHAAAWRAVVEHYGKRSPEVVAGAAYLARQSKREGGADAVAAILAAGTDAAATVAALDAMPKASPKASEGAPAEAKPVTLDAVLDMLARAASQPWTVEEAHTIGAAMATAHSAILDSALAAEAEAE